MQRVVLPREKACWDDLPKDIKRKIMIHRGFLCIGPYTGRTASVMRRGLMNLAYMLWVSDIEEVQQFWLRGKTIENGGIVKVLHSVKRKRSEPDYY